VRQETIQVTVDVPAALADEQTPARAKVLLVLDAVRSERMGWRAAASALGVSLSEFLDMAQEHGVPISRADLEDLRQDLETLDRIISATSDNE
jgi:predicted HTH domain antitoxin